MSCVMHQKTKFGVILDVFVLLSGKECSHMGTTFSK